MSAEPLRPVPARTEPLRTEQPGDGPRRPEPARAPRALATAPRPSRREREFLRREREILDNALALFNRDDWESVTVEQVARETDIGKGTVYKHFESKDEIYARLALEFHANLIEALRAVEPALPVLERIREMIRVAWESHMSSVEYHRVVMYCLRDDFRRRVKPQTYAAFEALDAAYAEIIHPVLAEGIEAGLLPRRPVASLMFGAGAALRGATLMAWAECARGVDTEQMLEETTRFILAGLIYNDHPV